MSRYVMALAVLLIAPAAEAAGPLIITVDDPSQQAKPTFIPLNSARPQVGNNHQALPLVDPKERPVMKPLRSDKQARADGQMLIDRAKASPNVQPHSLLITPSDQPATLLKSEVLDPPPAASPAATTTLEANPGALERDSEEIEGNVDGRNPILSLFGADTGPTSFRDAMAGRSTGTVTGVGHQAVWPVALDAKQYLSSGYGMRSDPFNGRPTFHGGIDIAAPTGTPVLATSDAVVMEVEWDRGYGKYITLQHSNGMLSRYGHLSLQSVTPGQHVRAGETIGAVGQTGRATGAHLDYRVSKDGLKFDPLTVLSIPPQVTMKVGSPVPLAVAVHDGHENTPAAAATHATPKHPMVIEVR